MDPKQVLWEIFLAAQRIGQSSSKVAVLASLDEIEEKTQNLKKWIESGGFKPDMYVWVDWS